MQPSCSLRPHNASNWRSRLQAAIAARWHAHSTDPDASWAHEKFVTRARTLFYARVAFLFIGLGLFAVPAWSQAFGIRGHAFIVYFTMLGYSIANLLVIEHRPVGRYATFLTLCFDLLVVVYLIEASGGLRSPLFATQLMYTTIFVILFPKPLAILPPLLTLPVVAKIDTLLGTRELGVIDLLLLIWYSALNIIIVYVIVYLNEREEAAHRDVVSLERDLQSLAVVEERSRLSREIHDGLGASLSSLILQAEYLQTLARDEVLLREIRELKTCAEESIDELRRSLRMMRTDFELVPAVEDYCRTFSDRSKIPLIFEREGMPRPLSSDAHLTIFRVLQEALSNASKHGQAKSLAVRLRFVAQRMELSVNDDGLGFDTRSTPQGHYGLTNMRERAAKVGGEVLIESAPGHGAKVTLLIPLSS